MSLADRCLQFFDPPVRTRGQRYFNNGQVVLRALNENGAPRRRRGPRGLPRSAPLAIPARAGDRLLHVSVLCRQGSMQAYLGHYAGRGRQGAGPKGRQPLNLVGLDPAAYEPPDDDFDDEDFDGGESDDVDDSDVDLVPPRRAAKASPKGRPRRDRPPPKPKWQQQARLVGRSGCGRRAASPRRRKTARARSLVRPRCFVGSKHQ